MMEPIQFIARLAALVPPPRHPLIRLYGCFAPDSSWRSSVVPEPLPPEEPAESGAGDSSLPIAVARSSSNRINWAELLKRVYDVDALACECGGRLRFIALITERETARIVLRGHGLPTEPPHITSARTPCLADFCDMPAADYPKRRRRSMAPCRRQTGSRVASQVSQSRSRMPPPRWRLRRHPRWIASKYPAFTPNKLRVTTCMQASPCGRGRTALDFLLSGTFVVASPEHPLPDSGARR